MLFLGYSWIKFLSSKIHWQTEISIRLIKMELLLGDTYNYGWVFQLVFDGVLALICGSFDRISVSILSKYTDLPEQVQYIQHAGLQKSVGNSTGGGV